MQIRNAYKMKSISWYFLTDHNGSGFLIELHIGKKSQCPKQSDALTLSSQGMRLFWYGDKTIKTQIAFVF